MTSSMTPLMRQYHDIKARFPEEIVLFQVGDFYELFYDDAQKAAAQLGIVLTARGTNNGQPIPLCGFPRHTLDSYLVKLINGGFRVVVCDQMSTGESTKLIERTVSQVLTPGTLTDSKLLDEKSAAYVCTVVATEQAYALLFVEALTGKAYATITTTAHAKLLEAELSRFMPQEIIMAPQPELEKLVRAMGYTITTIRAASEYTDACLQWLKALPQDGAVQIIERSFSLQMCVQLLYAFLSKNNPAVLQHIKHITLYRPDDFLMLDASTQRNLELVKNQDGIRAHTLFAVLDRAATPMGSRTIKKWILRPLADLAQIEQRLSSVQTLIEHSMLRDQLVGVLRNIGDIERVIGRIALQRAQLHDYSMLMRFLQQLTSLASLLTQGSLQQIGAVLTAHHEACMQLYHLLVSSIYDENEREWMIRAGYHAELDRLRTLVDSGSQQILELEQREQQVTGIASLKIRFNNAHGYGIEVTKPQLHLVPERYQRLQILVNRDRFTTPELRSLEYDMQRAQADSIRIEKELFTQICAQVHQYVPVLHLLANVCAELDGFIGFACSAVEQHYVRPIFTTSRDLMVHQSRHPVVEAKIKSMGQGQFIANDVTLTQEERLWIITGPNMGGKSTFLRQTALIIVMAQAGSFVPAAYAQLPLFDRIFTRIGAADNVAQGKSTFWVEMEETALICNEATEKSLVILDEVGRGTSTYDGLAIAQAVLEYIYAQIKARCLFATHYHELTELAQKNPGIVAYHAASKKTIDGIVFLHQIKKGCAQGSFGIEVAKNAQLPAAVIARAQLLLAELSQGHVQIERSTGHTQLQSEQLFTPCSLSPQEYERYQQLVKTIAQIDLDALSPRQAFDVVGNLKEMFKYGEKR